MIKVIRYSANGFEPQYQSHHIAENQVCVDESAAKEFLASVSEGLRPIIASTLAENSKFIKAHWEDLQNGIWVFIDGHKNNQSLNHLKNKVPCWSAELPEDTEVYDVNLKHTMKLSDPECLAFGCYIPARNLKDIQNIQRVIKLEKENK